MDTVLLGLRVALSLAVVLGLIWFAGRRLQGSATVRKQRTVPLSVLGRQSLGKGAAVALVEVAGRVLLVGVGEQGVSLLTEVDVPAAPDAGTTGERPAEIREPIDLSALAGTADDVVVPRVPQPHDDGATRMSRRAGAAEGGALAGSALSPDTWRRAVDAVQRRTARR
jgi:flagellar protein FliO/FliZ